MSYVSNSPDLEEKQDPSLTSQGPVSPTGGGGAVHLAPSSAVASIGGGGSPAASGGGAAPAGGQFGSLNQYLTANQGQATPLAGQLVSGIGQQYKGLQGQNTSTINDINSQVSAGSAPSQDAANATIAQESANPASFASTPSNVASFQGLLNASYGGPASAEGTTGYTKQQSNINNAIAAGQSATTTEAGRENLLSQNEAAPTTGVTALNSAILSQDPTALGNVESAYKPFSNLLTGLSSGASAADQQIASQQAIAGQDAAASNAAINSQINALNTGVTGALTTAQQNAATQNAQVKKDLAAGTPTTSDLAALGMNSDQWNALSSADKAAATSNYVTSANGQWGAQSGTTTMDPTKFLTQQDPNTAFTAANVATPEQYQQAQAYQSLLSGLNTGAPAALINQSTVGQAGTAPTNTNTYDYKGALGAAQDATSAEQAATQAYVAAIQAGADETHAQQAAAASAQQFGAASAVLPGIAGSFPATVKSTLKDITHPSLKNLGQGIENTFNAENASAKAGLNTVVNTVKNIFCFHPDTLIEMANGSLKMICKIRIGDETRGGMVLATTRGLGQGFYWYNGVLVTAKHAVKEDGTWIRVEDSKKAQPFKYLTEVVCNLVTEKHRIWANGIEFADEHENDNYENLNLQDSLDALNNQ